MRGNLRPKISRVFGELCIETPFNKGFVEAIKAVVPSSSRRYDKGMWYVNATYYSCAIALLEHYWGSTFIDSVGGVSEPQTSSWKESWQVFKDTDWKRQEREGFDKTRIDWGKEASYSAYATLYVTQDAPKQVIVAAYRALASLHHPDNGGDTEVMARINAAYQELKKKDRV